MKPIPPLTDMQLAANATQRLEKAFALLEQGEHNVSESAFAVGYTNVSHFSEAFQKRFGILPRVLIR